MGIDGHPCRQFVRANRPVAGATRLELYIGRSLGEVGPVGHPDTDVIEALDQIGGRRTAQRNIDRLEVVAASPRRQEIATVPSSEQPGPNLARAGPTRAVAHCTRTRAVANWCRRS